MVAHSVGISEDPGPSVGGCELDVRTNPERRELTVCGRDRNACVWLTVANLEINPYATLLFY